MMIPFVFILAWIAIPKLFWKLCKRAGIGVKWRASLLSLSATCALAGLSLYVNGPAFLSSNPAINRIYYDSSDANYYRTLAIAYGVLTLIHIGLTYARAPFFALLTTAQFWLLHIGFLLPAFAYWATSLPDKAIENTSATIAFWNKVSLVGAYMSAASALLLLVTLIWAVWSRLRTPRQV